MKSKILQLIILAFVLLFTYQFAKSQVPQGFSYQAVIRDGNGSPLATKDIGMKITLENASGVAYFSETQRPQTNVQGVVTINIGTGTLVGANTFAGIPWKNGDVYIKIEIDPAGGTTYSPMGTHTKLQSVPYALYAENTKEVVSNPNALADDPIFEVKNKTGQVVFGVYQGGVRVYVEDTQIKGAKGGFAVGGLTNQAKAGQAEYFRITPDSARIWVKEVPSVKGAKGGFAVGGLTNQGKSTISSQLIQLTPKNYFIGYESGINISSGLYNSFFGYQSGKNTTLGGNNVFSGYQSGMANTVGSYNVFTGFQSGLSNTTGVSNVFIGHNSGLGNTEGWSNNFIGEGAGYTNTTGTNDIFIGNDAGRLNTTSSGNTFIGRNSGYQNTTGWGNTYLGHMSGEKITSGTNNLILGVNAGNNKTSGSNNVLVGSYCGLNSADGSYNVFVGAGAGNDAAGSSNVFIGNEAGYSETGSNKLYIANSSGTPLIGGDFSTNKVNISNILNITGISYTPTSSAKGDIVRFEGNLSYSDGLYIYTGTIWKLIISLP